MGTALQRLVEEDHTLRVIREHDTNETIMSGMGESHVDVAVRRLKQKFGVELLTSVPKLPYKETITKVTQVQGRHKKQTGGRGQFGDAWIRFEPLPRGAGFEFTEEVFGGSVPHSFIPAVEKGMREIISKGVLAGYPTVDFRAVLYDGSYHPVDSSEIAFKLAAHKAFKAGIPQAGPVLLEQIVNVTVTVPDQFMGDVLGDLNTKRAACSRNGPERRVEHRDRTGAARGNAALRDRPSLDDTGTRLLYDGIQPLRHGAQPHRDANHRKSAQRARRRGNRGRGRLDLTSGLCI